MAFDASNAPSVDFSRGKRRRPTVSDSLGIQMGQLDVPSYRQASSDVQSGEGHSSIREGLML